MKVFGIVGWKNSGKTYFAQKIIEKLSLLNMKVASIKHAHHNFEIDKPGTDSFLHRQSGSRQVIISSSKRWAKISELHDSKEKRLNDLLNELNKPDVVIVEGFKNEDHLKIEVIKDPSDPSTFMFNKLKNVTTIITDKKIKDFKNKQFKKNQIDEIVNFILNYKYE
jgi:molybdopterin-guanine dinucleotide biosynthesis protein B